MTLPVCPRCRQKMSATEYGHLGAFVCFYCDGTWLPGTAIAAISAQDSDVPVRDRPLPTSAGEMTNSPGLACPDCGCLAFRRFAQNGNAVDHCAECAGMYFPKDTFESAFPHATKDAFPLAAIGGALAGESIFWAAVIFLAGMH